MHRRQLLVWTITAVIAAGLLPVTGVAQSAPSDADKGRWSSEFPRLDGDVMALATRGDTLYAGGYFVSAGGVTVNSVVMWDGQRWRNLGSGVNHAVQALAVDERGTLYAGGGFTEAGGRQVGYIASWDGKQWQKLGTGVNATVYALAFGPDGTLYAGGSFTRAGNVDAPYIAMWRDGRWEALGSGTDHNVFALAPTPDGRLYAAGGFTMAGGKSAHQVAFWNGTEWEQLGGGIHPAFAGHPVRVLALEESGTLYAGGNFDSAGDHASPYLARWDGRRWTPLGSGVDGGVNAMALHSDGSLFVGGYFTRAGGVPASHVARWKDGRWYALSGGTNDLVHALTLGPGGLLHVGGSFETAEGSPARRLACWQLDTATSAERDRSPTPDARSIRVYPNPSTDVVRIGLVVDRAHDVRLKMFDALGRERASAGTSVMAPGHHEIVLDTSHLPSGAYFFVIDAGSSIHTASAIVRRP